MNAPGPAIGIDAAGENVAPAFSRIMRAATSRYGVFTDPPLVCVAVALVVVASVMLYNLEVITRSELPIIYAVAVLPIALALGVHASLGKARATVVAWLGALPFALQNVNALLNGVGMNLLVRFSGAPPDRDALNALLEVVHPDCFALEFHESEPEVEVRIGVSDSKLNPAAANHRRFARVRALVDGCLVPLSADHPIEWVRIA